MTDRKKKTRIVAGETVDSSKAESLAQCWLIVFFMILAGLCALSLVFSALTFQKLQRYQKENNSLETDFKSIFAEQWEAKEKTISGKVRGFVPVSDFNVLDKKVSDLREELHSHVANVRRRVNQEIARCAPLEKFNKATYSLNRTIADNTNDVMAVERLMTKLKDKVDDFLVKIQDLKESSERRVNMAMRQLRDERAIALVDVARTKDIVDFVPRLQIYENFVSKKMRENEKIQLEELVEKLMESKISARDYENSKKLLWQKFNEKFDLMKFETEETFNKVNRKLEKAYMSSSDMMTYLRRRLQPYAFQSDVEEKFDMLREELSNSQSGCESDELMQHYPKRTETKQLIRAAVDTFLANRTEITPTSAVTYGVGEKSIDITNQTMVLSRLKVLEQRLDSLKASVSLSENRVDSLEASEEVKRGLLETNLKSGLLRIIEEMRKAVKTVQKEFVSVKSLEEMLSTSLNNYEEVRSDLDVMSRRLGQSESGLDRFKSDSYRMFVSAIDFTESNTKIKSELRTCAKQSDIDRSLQPYVLQTEFDRKYGSQQTDHKSFTKLVNDLRDTNEAHLRHLDDSFKNQIMNQTSLIQSQIQHLGMYQQQNKEWVKRELDKMLDTITGIGSSTQNFIRKKEYDKQTKKLQEMLGAIPTRLMMEQLKSGLIRKVEKAVTETKSVITSLQTTVATKEDVRKMLAKLKRGNSWF